MIGGAANGPGTMRPGTRFLQPRCSGACAPRSPSVHGRVQRRLVFLQPGSPGLVILPAPVETGAGGRKPP